jgi:hypothetical protein
MNIKIVKGLDLENSEFKKRGLLKNQVVFLKNSLSNFLRDPLNFSFGADLINKSY